MVMFDTVWSIIGIHEGIKPCILNPFQSLFCLDKVGAAVKRREGCIQYQGSEECVSIALVLRLNYSATESFLSRK